MPTSGSQQGEDVCHPGNELWSCPDDAVAVEEKGVELVEEFGVLFDGCEVLGGA